jgi:hypothetical protein
MLLINNLPEDWHFFSTSTAHWRKGVNLEEQIRFHKKQGYTFLIYLVPCKEDVPYEINEYAPQVDGSFIIVKYVVVKGAKNAAWTIVTHRAKPALTTGEEK